MLQFGPAVRGLAYCCAALNSLPGGNVKFYNSDGVYHP